MVLNCATMCDLISKQNKETKMDASRQQERGISKIMPSFLTSVTKWTMLQDQIRVGADWEDKNHKLTQIPFEMLKRRWQECV